MMALLRDLLLLCVLVDMRVSTQPEIDGVWGDWGLWSSCSRTCGGGITYQKRYCRSGTCIGKSKIINSCNIQDCPGTASDFRAEQCAVFDKQPHNGTRYKWIPFLSPSLRNKCALHCRAKGFYFYQTFKAKVVDGTRCDENSYDMCVDGKCEKAGCDLIIGSEAVEDKCRVCNGGGRNCREVKDVFRTTHEKMGEYIDIVTIPAGARNVLIEDATNSYLALKDSSFSYVLNGDMTIMSASEIKAAGTTIKYKENKERDYITILGPTTENLLVALLVLNDKNVSVNYQYYIPKSHKVINHTIKYKWQTGVYGKCDKQCSGGIKTREVTCVREYDNAAMQDYQCDKASQPDKMTSCNEQPCAPRWFIGLWGPCSKTCGVGRQVRRVHCEQQTKDGLGMVNDNQCPGTKASNQRSCTILDECPKWTLGEWSQCSKSCGGGIRRRQVTCREMISNNGINDDKCPIYNRPRDMEPCGEMPCNTRWIIGDWGDCHPTCGSGMRTRSVYCGSTSDEQKRYPDHMCDENKPSMTKECVNTAKCPPMWYGSSWSKCTARCGKGMQMRNVFCGVKQSAKFVEILPNERCSPLPMMKKMQHCKTTPCHTQWVASNWGSCFCKDNKRYRKVRCYADEDIDPTGKACKQQEKPPTEDRCNQLDCLTTPAPNRSTKQQPTDSQQGPGVITAPELPIITTVETEPPTTFRRKYRVTERPTRPPIVTEGTTRPPIVTERPTRPPIVTESPARPPIVITENSTRSPEVTRSPTRTLEVTESPTRPAIVTRSATRPPIFTETRVTRPLITKIITEQASTTEIPITTTFYPRPDGDARQAVIIQGPINAAAYVGSDVTLSCVVQGHPNPDIFWMKGNLDVSIFGKRYETLDNGSLKIHSVQKVDEDNYTCIATNGYKEPQRSPPAFLVVETPPYVDITLGHTVKEGDKAVIECRGSGTPQPTLQWYKDGYRLKPQDTDRATVHPEMIIIQKTELNDGGKYECKATNKNGERTALMILHVTSDKQPTDISKRPYCVDMPSVANCAMVVKIRGYCQQAFYMNVCCQSCKEKMLNKIQL